MIPKVTVAILSWNRLNYLKATYLSARECIQYPNIEWIVSDNNSSEIGLLEFLHEQQGGDHLLVKEQSHASAMNEILKKASGDYLILWPDDVQFIVRGNWLNDFIEVMEENQDIGSLCLCHLRRTTMNQLFRPWYKDLKGIIGELIVFRTRFRVPRICLAKNGLKVQTYGWRKCGVCPSGIPSLTRVSTWKELGGWNRNRSGASIIDSSCGAEDNMLDRFYKLKKPWQRAIPFVPVAADIITDPLGCKAKIRGQYRYGVYMAPPVSPYYYKIFDYSDLLSAQGQRPVAFMDRVVPCGYSLPLDENGECRKYSINESVVYQWHENRVIYSPLEEIYKKQQS